MKYSPLKTYLTFCRENSNISTKLAKLLNIRAVKQRPMEMSECGWDWWPGFIPLLWACTSEGPSWEALPTVAGVAAVGEAGGVSLQQQHHCCLAKGLLCALHEAGGWEVEVREVWASWWSSWGAGPDFLEVQVGSGSFSSGRPGCRTAFLYILGASNRSQSSVLPQAGLPDMCHKELRMGTMTHFCQSSLAEK